MEARSRTIEQWFSMIEQGQIVLPRFQRDEAWRPAQIIGLFENVLRKPVLPIGALLVLEIGAEELFHSRPIVGAPAPTGKPAMHLLDGQQRMTALWRSLTDNYPDMMLFVSLGPPVPPDDSYEGGTLPDLPAVDLVRRWDRKGVRQPVWASNPGETFNRDQIPIHCLRPGSSGEAALEKWLADVRAAGIEPASKLGRIYDLRQRIAGYVIPFLSLGAETSRETALDVFIKMNTSASPLKDFDIVTAQLEEASGQSMRDLVEELLEMQPAAREFGHVQDIILSVAALLADQPPLKKTYLSKDFGGTLGENWPRILNGFKRGMEFLQSEGIFNEKCLPTDVAVYLICALWADIPEHSFDAEGNARTVLRKALWRACYTDRYGKTSATRAFADYGKIKGLFTNPTLGLKPDLFDELHHPLPAPEEIALAGWPSRRDRLPRATLATALRNNGLDFATGAPATSSGIKQREYHHIFPVGVLNGSVGDDMVNRAMNCALISWKTNRKIAAKTPREYIEKRAEASQLGMDEVRMRLASHLIPVDELLYGDYAAFLSKRSELISAHMKLLCDGKTPT